jgi:PAS domain-containing protein
MQDPRTEYQPLDSFDRGNESSLPEGREVKTVGGFGTSSDAFCAVDRRWRFTYANRRATVLWGRSEEELLRKNT